MMLSKSKSISLHIPLHTAHNDMARQLGWNGKPKVTQSPMGPTAPAGSNKQVH